MRTGRGWLSAASSVALPGWWDAKQKMWAEDAYQDGTATGNVAWAALALLNLYQATQNQAYRAGAERMLGLDHCEHARQRVPVGFSGGVDGFDNRKQNSCGDRPSTISTSMRVAAWLDRLDGTRRTRMSWPSRAAFSIAFSFPTRACFGSGRKPDGTLQPTDHLALDTQLWPLLAVADAPAAWRKQCMPPKPSLPFPAALISTMIATDCGWRAPRKRRSTLRSLGRRT